LPAANHGHIRQRLAVGGSVIGFEVSRPPFHDRRGRLALVLATDRERLADVTLRGYAFPAVGGPVPLGMPGRSPGIGLPYDPESARHHH
jgi:ABC-type transport system substrate-binding protein